MKESGLSITEDKDPRKMGGNFIIQFPEEVKQDTFSNSYPWSNNDLDKVIDGAVPTSEKEPLHVREQLIKLVDRLYETDFPDKEQTIAEAMAILVTKETQSSGSYAFRTLRSEISLEDIDAVQEHFKNQQQPEKAELIEKTKQTLSFDKYIPDDKLAEWYKSVMEMPSTMRQDYQLFVVFTGLRKTDACTIRWEDVDMKAGTLHRPNPKGGEARAFTIPLSDVCLAILKRRKEENEKLYPNSEWVFPTRSSKTGEIIRQVDGRESSEV